jgi:putative intracellular protease/amidase
VGSTVVVTGAAEQVAAVSAALRNAGAEVIAVDDLEELDAAVAGIAPGSLGCYVQLPVHVAARGKAVIERVRNFLEDGLLARFTAASTILPAMSDGGRVVLVGGNTPVEASAPDDQSARLALLDVLAHAIQADAATTRIRIRRLPNTESAEHIATVALGGEPTREEALADLQAREPKMSFDDLRIEVMGLVNGEF